MELSPRNAAKLLKPEGCPSYETVRQWALSGKIRAKRFNGRYWMINIESLKAYLEERSMNVSGFSS